MPTTTLERLLNRVRRRALIVVYVERVGVALLTSIWLTLLLLVVILASRRAPNPVLAGMGPALGIVVGMLWASQYRISRLRAAAILDQQLKLSDLFVSAILLGELRVDEHFKTALLWEAEQQSRAIEPRDLVMHRLSPRFWAGTTLSFSLLISIAVVGSFFAASTGRDGALAAVADDLTRSYRNDEAPGRQVAPRAQNVRPPGAENVSEGGRDQRDAMDANAPATSFGQSSGSANLPNDVQSSSGARGAAATNDHISVAPLNPVASNLNPTGNSDVGNQAGSGKGAAGANVATNTGNSQVITAPVGVVEATGLSDGKNVSNAVVDPMYRDMVRDYFAP